MFVARPMGVFLSLLFSRYSVKEKMFISWVGLRGVVPIVLVTYPFGANLPRSELIFNTIFFVVFISIIIQGMTLEKAAQKCGVKEEVAAEKADDVFIHHHGQGNAPASDHERYAVIGNDERKNRKYNRDERRREIGRASCRERV